MIRNNQNGRRRGRGNGARPPQGGGPSGNYGNNNGGGSRIDTRQRGNATQLLEKYKAMARDATQNGDRVQAEYFMQYADHYFRVLNEFRARDPQPAPRSTYDDDDDGYGAPGQNYAPPAAYTGDRDDEDGDDGDRREPVREQQAERSDAPRGGERYNGRANGERQPATANDVRGERRPDRDDRSPRDRDDRNRTYNGPRDGEAVAARTDSNRGDGARSYAPRADGPRESPRTEGYRDGNRNDRDGGRAEGYRESGRNENGRADGFRGDAVQTDGARSGEPVAASRDAAREEPAVTERQPETATLIGIPGPATIVAPGTGDDAVEPAAAPRRRGRPRKIVAESLDG